MSVKVQLWGTSSSVSRSTKPHLISEKEAQNAEGIEPLVNEFKLAAENREIEWPINVGVTYISSVFSNRAEAEERSETIGARRPYPKSDESFSVIEHQFH